MVNNEDNEPVVKVVLKSQMLSFMINDTRVIITLDISKHGEQILLKIKIDSDQNFKFHGIDSPGGVLS